MPSPESLVIWSLALLFLAAAFAPSIHRVLPRQTSFILAIFPLLTFCASVPLVPALSSGQTFLVVKEWLPSLGLTLAFSINGLSLLFLLIISLIGFFIVLYAGAYLKGAAELGRFMLYLLAFMGAMLGLVVADNLILLFIFWELTSITSYLLIGYYHNKAESRAAALQALIVTGGGGLCMLAGFLLLGNAAGTFEISELLSNPAAVLGHPQYWIILLLILLGAFTKSAQFPFHFWLPNAMAAPAPVSSFLHSATMVKAGVFLLARLHPVLDDRDLWPTIVAPVGAITMCVGIFLALGQSDLKKMLAYSTVAVLGTLVLLLGLGSELAIKACILYLLAHALYKAALFMVAGSIDHETGTRDIAMLGGLHKSMPITMIAAAVGALSMAGIPVFLGFVSKEYFYKALLSAEGPVALWESLGVLASIGMFAVALTAGFRPFWSAPKDTPKPPHEAPWTMWIGPIVLGILAIKFGLMPDQIASVLVKPAVREIAAVENVAEIKLWHGLTTALLLSGVTIVAGSIVFAFSASIRNAKGLYAAAEAVSPERLYNGYLSGLAWLSALQTRFLQSGSLRNYILTIGCFFGILIIARLPFTPVDFDASAMVQPSIFGVGACLLIAASAVAACLAQSRISAIVILGVAGLAIAMLFFLYSAPDLALTQVLIETLTVLLFVLTLGRLPLLQTRSLRGTMLRDVLLASAFGAIMTILVLIAFHVDLGQPPISEFMNQTSYPEAHGRNVVNVILVDFRALDTLGEITVLAIAALGIGAVLAMGSSKGNQQ